MWNNFWDDRSFIEDQYHRIKWPADFSSENFEKDAEALTADIEAKGTPRSIVKAALFSWTLDNAPVAADPYDFFQDHIRHGFVLEKQREKWIKEALEGEMGELYAESQKAFRLGAYTAHYDFSHTSPDWNDVLSLGFPGLLRRVRENRKRHAGSGDLDAEKKVFYDASELVYLAVLRYVNRLEAACAESAAAEENADKRDRLLFCARNLNAVASHEPQTIFEALQTAYLYYILQEEMERVRMRSFAGLDRLYERFYRGDINSGRFSRKEIKTLLQYFFQKLHAGLDTYFGNPFFLGGLLPDGSCAYSDFTELIIDAYDELNIKNPKIHIRCSENLPRSFAERICDCIRHGKSSFVFINDDVAVSMMRECGASLEEAREYVPIGCYEPVIMGKEVGCTENGGLNMPKTLEIALHNGIDPLSGEELGLKTGEPESFKTFDDLLAAVKSQQRFFIERAQEIIVESEKRYMRMNPSPLFSATMAQCVEQGKDAYAGGARYNNSSFWAYSPGSLVDGLSAIYKLVYREKKFTLPELVKILDADWKGREDLRREMLRDLDKWGNNRELPDRICVEISKNFAEAVNGLRNGRGGRFKAAMFTINYNVDYGVKTGASADGRKKGEPLSRNMGASTAMDRAGVTALIESVTKLDHSAFPDGSVLDVMLHPSAVEGAEGLNAFVSLVKSYMSFGGFAIQFNVFNTSTLKDAQANPEKYANLQVRLCGWNVYWNDLSEVEQNAFIKRAGVAEAV
jgi:formate C-acetyltransferase